MISERELKDMCLQEMDNIDISSYDLSSSNLLDFILEIFEAGFYRGAIYIYEKELGKIENEINK